MTKKIKQKKTKTSTKAAKTARAGKNVKKTAAVKVKEAPKAAITPVVAAPEVAPAKPAISGREAARLALVQKAATSKWASLYSKANKIPVNPYNLKKEYEIETAIEHKTLGWGYIQDKKNDRLEVLFENGIKYLISNYK